MPQSHRVPGPEGRLSRMCQEEGIRRGWQVGSSLVLAVVIPWVLVLVPAPIRQCKQRQLWPSPHLLTLRVSPQHHPREANNPLVPGGCGLQNYADSRHSPNHTGSTLSCHPFMGTCCSGRSGLRAGKEGSAGGTVSAPGCHPTRESPPESNQSLHLHPRELVSCRGRLLGQVWPRCTHLPGHFAVYQALC